MSNVYDRQILQALKDEKDRLMAETWDAIRQSYRKGNLDTDIGNDKVALLKLNRLEDNETAPTYDTDDLQIQMDKIIARIEETNQIILDGWNDKQRDYANDSR
tara:strand:+ start:12730 stop:13038 length:309 start_codon:yes stop_codon:yes gene_type:complete